MRARFVLLSPAGGGWAYTANYNRFLVACLPSLWLRRRRLGEKSWYIIFITFASDGRSVYTAYTSEDAEEQSLGSDSCLTASLCWVKRGGGRKKHNRPNVMNDTRIGFVCEISVECYAKTHSISQRIRNPVEINIRHLQGFILYGKKSRHERKNEEMKPPNHGKGGKSANERTRLFFMQKRWNFL